MKVVLGVPWFLPDSIGGTEIYVASLADELQKLGVECVVAVPGKDGKSVTSSYRNIRTVHYPSPLPQSPSQDILASVPADSFREWLALEQPDIYHQHDWSLNCGLTHLQAAKALEITTFMTIHLAKLICITRTMICEGKSQCDGQIFEERCGRCFLRSRGIPSGIAAPLAQIPTNVSAGLARLAGIGGVFSGRTRASKSAAGLNSVADSVDCIIAVSQWLKAALLINGVPEEKAVFVRSGIDPEFVASVDAAERKPDAVLRIGFLGRWIEAKGLHVLIAALQRLPKTAQFSLKVLGLHSADKVDIAYRERMENMVAGQPQYQLLSNQPRTAIKEFYRNIDILAVPSQLLENAPLVVLEANAWKVPVIGSDLGGIREMVRHQIDGLLVPHANIAAWTDALNLLAQDPKILQRLQNNIPPLRTMRDTARDMKDLYRMHAGSELARSLTSV